MKITVIIFGSFALLFLSVGIGNYFYISDFINKATPAQGVVVRNTGGGFDSHYYPVIKYKALDGKEYEFVSTDGSNPPEYKAGEKVDLLYLEGEPDSVRINSWFSLRGLSIIFSAFGAVILGGMFLIWFALKKGIIVVVDETTEDNTRESK